MVSSHEAACSKLLFVPRVFNDDQVNHSLTFTSSFEVEWKVHPRWFDLMGGDPKCYQFLQDEHHDKKRDRKQKYDLRPNVQLFMQQNTLPRSCSIGRRQEKMVHAQAFW